MVLLAINYERIPLFGTMIACGYHLAELNTESITDFPFLKFVKNDDNKNKDAADEIPVSPDIDPSDIHVVVDHCDLMNVSLSDFNVKYEKEFQEFERYKKLTGL